jgi:hypothetical protein
MKQGITAIWLLASLLPGIGATPARADTALTGANLFDGASEVVREGVTVLVRDGRIRGILEGEAPVPDD